MGAIHIRFFRWYHELQPDWRRNMTVYWHMPNHILCHRVHNLNQDLWCLSTRTCGPWSWRRRCHFELLFLLWHQVYLCLFHSWNKRLRLKYKHLCKRSATLPFEAVMALNDIINVKKLLKHWKRSILNVDRCRQVTEVILSKYEICIARRLFCLSDKDRFQCRALGDFRARLFVAVCFQWYVFFLFCFMEIAGNVLNNQSA